MKTRIIAGVIGAIILLTVVSIGNTVLDVAILMVTMVGLYEYHNAVKNKNDVYIPRYMNYILAIALFITNIFNIDGYFKYILFIYSIILFMHLIFIEKIKLEDISNILFGGIYIVFFLSHIYSLNGIIYIWYVFLIAWLTDTCAYFTGVLVGKHKLIPKLSPNKTIEGSLGGIAGAVIGTLIFSKTFNTGHYIEIGLMALVGSIVSQCGDLTASKIKRQYNVKDFGNIMPGHGGVLDRFDSIIYTAPFVYYSIKLIGLI